MDAFHIGPQKTATSWVYECLREHPEVAPAETDAVHYFDMHYARGRAWYERHFPEAGPDQRLYDPTPSYIRSPWAPRRIARENPDARILLSLRDPVQRAFSHYWHEKKKGKHRFAFREVLENYDLYASWVEPGLYAEHIERYLRHFERDQLLVLRFDHLSEDPAGYLERIHDFLEVDRGFRPSLLEDTVNRAGPRRTGPLAAWRGLKRAGRKLGLDRALDRLGVGDLPRRLERAPGLRRLLRRKDEYERGVDPELERELRELCRPEVERLEGLLDLDLEAWK